MTKKEIVGFKIIIARADGSVEEDSAWETCTGGALNIEITQASIGSDQFHTTTPGHKYVDEIQLRGPMTKSRKWAGQNINEISQGKDSRFDLTIVEIMKDGSEGRRYTYQNCFIARYVYPVLSSDSTGNLYEEVSIKPERLNLA